MGHYVVYVTLDLVVHIHALSWHLPLLLQAFINAVHAYLTAVNHYWITLMTCTWHLFVLKHS